MKTYQYWCGKLGLTPHYATIIRDIQRDALIHARDVCLACGGNHRESTIRNNVQICARAIEREAAKLEPTTKGTS